MNLKETIELIEFAKERKMIKSPFNKVVQLWLQFKMAPLYDANEKIQEGLEDE